MSTLQPQDVVCILFGEHASPARMPTQEAPTMVVPDYRRPGQSLPPWSLRLPPKVAADLEQQADRLQTTRAGLARALLAQGLENLKAA